MTGTATLENCFIVSYELKHKRTRQYNHPITNYQTKLKNHIHAKVIYSEVETAQTVRWRYKL